jgi:ribosomal protein S18 acetylase RimI-like enzyme
VSDLELVRYADRPDLAEIRFATLSQRTFPTFMHHNQTGTRYWARLVPEHPEFQLALVGCGHLVAELHSLPLAWDGTLADLPPGWDDVFERSFESGRAHDCLAALAISVLPERQGEGLAARMIEAMCEAGRVHGLRELIAPVRPTLKERYPLIPIERYVEWRRDDGAHFDPWIRIHERAGGEIVAPAPESMRIEAAAADWEEWTGMRFPDDGEFVVPGMLSPLRVRSGIGVHVEPNVWIRHRLLPSTDS